MKKNYQEQLELAYKRAKLMNQLIEKEGTIEVDADTNDLVEYYNTHTLKECKAKFLRLQMEITDIYNDAQSTNPFASPTQIELSFGGEPVRAFLLRVSNPRLVYCQDRILQMDDLGSVVHEIDLLKIFAPFTNL